MTLRRSDLQSDSDLDSIRNACDVLIAIIISFQKMYGFGGLGEVEVEIWSDVTIAGRPNKKGKIELLSH